jgi:ribonuclease P protein component
VLSARHRLRRSADFTTVVRRGRRAGRRRLVVHLLLTEEPLPPRCGLVVSKAVGSAATRNTVKRRLRHLMREKMPQLPEGSMLVLRALPAAAGAGSAELATDLDSALSSALGGARVARPGRGGGR